MTSASNTDETRRGAWEVSYENRQNFVFYPEEEMVRFVSKHLRKRTGLDSFEDRTANVAGMPVLDVGCGIGRHMVMALDFGFEPYGFDLSETAVETARKWLGSRGLADPANHIHQSDIRSLPFEDEFFGCAISHGVLDSMPFAIAKEGMGEVARTLRPDSLFYCDLIGGGDHEEIIETHHEKDTLQSFFTPEKIDELIGDHFNVVDRIRVEREDTMSDHVHTRWHLTLRKKG